MEDTTPKPGSPEAVEQGCLCPMIDNGQGRGARGTQSAPPADRVYWIHGDCPLHGEGVGP